MCATLCSWPVCLIFFFPYVLCTNGPPPVLGARRTRCILQPGGRLSKPDKAPCIVGRFHLRGIFIWFKALLQQHWRSTRYTGIARAFVKPAGKTQPSSHTSPPPSACMAGAAHQHQSQDQSGGRSTAVVLKIRFACVCFLFHSPVMLYAVCIQTRSASVEARRTRTGARTPPGRTRAGAFSPSTSPRR